jgi:intron-binding protein aquarius
MATTAHATLSARRRPQSLEDEMVRTQALKVVSLPLWHALSEGRLQLELHAQPALAKHWKVRAVG